MDELWGDTAPCSGATAVFFPPTEEMANASWALAERYEKAKAICADCPSVFACHARWIAARRPDTGVWFGTSPQDREKRMPAQWRVCHRCSEPLGAELIAEHRKLHPLCAEANRAERYQRSA